MARCVWCKFASSCLQSCQSLHIIICVLHAINTLCSYWKADDYRKHNVDRTGSTFSIICRCQHPHAVKLTYANIQALNSIIPLCCSPKTSILRDGFMASAWKMQYSTQDGKYWKQDQATGQHVYYTETQGEIMRWLLSSIIAVQPTAPKKSAVESISKRVQCRGITLAAMWWCLVHTTAVHHAAWLIHYSWNTLHGLLIQLTLCAVRHNHQNDINKSGLWMHNGLLFLREPPNLTLSWKKQLPLYT